MFKHFLEREMISPKELSQLAGISTNTLYYWIQKRRIPYIKMGRLVRFRVSDLEKFIDERPITIKQIAAEQK